MKHITLALSLSVSFMFSYVLHIGTSETSNFRQSNAPTKTITSPYCNVIDSLTLIDIYEATDGDNWFISWDTTMPVCTWAGVTLNPAGNVTQIELNNNNLIGTLPAGISALAATLTELYLDNNCISGPIPPDIGDCLLLTTLFLDDNKFTGTIPASFGQLTLLTTLFLDNNELSGIVPIELLTMTSLLNFDIFGNCFDSLPDLSSMLSLQANKLKVQNNKLTFDDLLPNQVEIGPNYIPQDSFGIPMTICLPTGLDTFVDLGIDAGITSNTYQWFKDGLPYATTTTNKLWFTPVDWSDAGVYTANVTNSIMTGLTLNGRPITVKIVCGQSINKIEENYCSGSGASMTVGGVTYDEGFPTGSTTVAELDQYGCDSIVVVDLNFYSPPPVIIDTILCPGQSIIVNGEEYDETNPSGIENLGPIALFGCDSTIVIDVSYFPVFVHSITSTICREDTVFVNGSAYHFENPIGMDTISGVAFHGCDSIVSTNLSFHPVPLEVFDDVLCTGNSITIAGTEYNAANPSDTILLENGSMVTGCDSIIHIDLSFGAGVEITIDDFLCAGEAIIVGSTTYNQATPDGTEFFPSSGPTECDTNIIIDLSFYLPDTSLYNPSVCQGGSIMFNGSLYDAATPNGFETLSSTIYPQCDSIVEVQLTFTAAPSSTIDTTLCPGESIVVNGEVYDEGEPSGTEIFTMSGFCDSMVVIDVSFYPEAINEIDTTICNGDSIEISGVIYHATNTGSIITLDGMSFHGCDSTIDVTVNFFPEAVLNIDTTICAGASIFIDGTEYNESNPTGSSTVSTPSFHGCDSIVNIEVSFYPLAENSIDQTLCFGESLIINGTEYDEANPTDTIVISGVSFHLCDSLIYINLDFYPEAIGTYNNTLCPGDSVLINGTWYHEGFTVGQELFPLQSFNNCDSTLNVSIDFYPVAESSIDETLCFGEETMIGGILFNASNPTDTIVLSGVTENSCDSTIYVNLSFHPEAYELINPTLCFGQSIQVNGINYNEANPSGMDTLVAGSYHLCDSIIEVDLTFNNAVQITMDQMICLDENLIIEDTIIFDSTNPSGTVTIEMGSYLGCDSVIVVDLQYPNGPAENTIDGFHCPDVSFVVNGTLYDIDSPMGTQVLGGASSFGCDSTVFVDLQFYAPATSTIDTTLCPGGSITINSIVFDESNPTGSVDLGGASFHGCDSTITVLVDFYAPAINDFAPNYCDGQSITIEGILYNINNPSDTIISSSPSFAGCDSILYINLSFSDAVEVDVDGTFCPDYSVMVNGTEYNIDMPSGDETIEEGSYTGCDSIIHVNLDFHNPDDLVYLFQETICAGDTIFVNGTAYHQTNPSGNEILPGASYTTCDSAIVVQLDFYNNTPFEFNETICTNDSIEINGIFYSSNNPPPALIIIPDASYNGCDSMLNIALEFHTTPVEDINMTICSGESIMINGVVFDESNTMGIETLEGASYFGCDSIIQIQIGFYPAAENTSTVEICEGDSYIFNGETYTVGGSYMYTLTDASANGCDSLDQLELIVLSAEDIGLADAGEDQNICDDEVLLSANAPAGTTGVWNSWPQGVDINSPGTATTLATGLTETDYTFIWTLSNAVCSNYDSDTMNVTIGILPIANDDSYVIEQGQTLLQMGLIDNDLLNGLTDWTIEFPSPPLGTLEDLGDGLFDFVPDETLFGTEISFEYLLCNESCACDTALVTILIEENSKEFPNAITPNDDGLNDVFMIPFLEEDPDQFLTRELIVYNRWGDIVWQAKPYLNDWGGTNQSGHDLPQGTYYYLFRLVLGDGKIYKGDVTILK